MPSLSDRLFISSLSGDYRGPSDLRPWWTVTRFENPRPGVIPVINALMELIYCLDSIN